MPKSKGLSFLPVSSGLFFIPIFVLVCIILSLGTHYLLILPTLSTGILLIGIVVGSWQLVHDTLASLFKFQFALDYIALLAITTGLITGNYLVAAVIVLMMSGGNTLENYATEKARHSLKALTNRIPHTVEVLSSDNIQTTVSINTIDIGTTIVVRKGEIVPLDGMLISAEGVFDESSLTGEPYPVNKQAGDLVRSGTVNVGQVITLKTTVRDEQSTYHSIITLVEQAQLEKAPFIQLADALSGWFTIVTLILATVAYFISHDFSRALAVLVIATPCPLILATPIALIGGMSTAAKRRIIFKHLSSLEILAKTDAIIFDKTGTITLGTPSISRIEITAKKMSEAKVLQIAAGIERNSLHPFARAIVNIAKEKKLVPELLSDIHEELGKGIMARKGEHIYAIEKNYNHPESSVVLLEDRKVLATFSFTDDVKPESAITVHELQQAGLKIFVFTGDKEERARQVLHHLPAGVTLRADCTPQDKRNGISELKNKKLITAMVGDGINDAPALALADVGLVFSHQEHTAASEAADVILLGGDFASVLTVIQISKRTMAIAKQSMYIGLGLSLIGMIVAAFGYLPPLAGAVTQEVIDVAVILNALRAAL